MRFCTYTLLVLCLLILTTVNTVQGQCAQQCSPNQFWSSGQGCLSCTNSCVNGSFVATCPIPIFSLGCLCQCNGNWSGGSCDECPSPWTGSACNIDCSPINCSAGQTFSTSNCRCNSCSNSCGNGSFQTENSCACNCRANWTGPSCSECSLTTCPAGQALNSNTCQCEACPSCGNGSHDPNSCSCSCNQNWGGAQCDSCLLTTCPAGQILNASTCSCVACTNSCTNGSLTTPNSCACTCPNSWSGPGCDVCSLTSSSCPLGQFLDDFACKCVDCPNACENESSLTTPGSCQCGCLGNWIGESCNTCPITTCPVGQTLDSTACNCVPCTNTCSGNSAFDTPNSCECSCTGNWSGSQCDACDVTCPATGITNTSTCDCECPGVSCGAGETLNSSTCLCETCTNTCPPTSSFQTSGSCDCSCDGLWTGVLCDECSLQCPVGQKVNSSTCTCEVCAVGSTDCFPHGTIKSLIDVDIEFHDITDINGHFNQLPITITPPQPDIQIIIPHYPQYNTKSAQIKLHAYLGSDASQSTTLTSTMITIATTNNKIIVDLIPPHNAIFNKLFYAITFPPVNPTISTTPTILTSPIFATKASCYTPPSDTSLHNDITSWPSQCGLHGTCSSLTQICKCSSLYQGTSCDVPIEQCQQCTEEHLSSCTSDNECICSNGWTGSLCQIESHCESKSNKQCNGKNGNGYLTPSIIPGKCSNTCICNNQWSGLSCQSCTLQCFNGGEAYNKCDLCGCASGFTGEQCQCNGIRGDITVNGYNNAIISYDNLLPLLIEQGGVGLSEKELDLFGNLEIAKNVIETTINSIVTKHLQLSSQSVMVSLQSIKSSPPLNLNVFPFDKTSTLISFALTFGCEEHNPQMTRTTLISYWDQMISKLSKQDDFTALFTFHNDIITIDPGDIEDVPSTLPPDYEVNGSFNINNNMNVFPLGLFLLFFVTLIL